MAAKLFSEDDVQSRLALDRALEAVKTTYTETARGRVLNPPKLAMHMGDDGCWPDRNAFSIDMPAYVDWLDVAGTKWAVATWDAEIDTPISSLILLFDLDDGRFKAVLEGMYITGVRTAIQSVIGMNNLPASQAGSVGIIGAGFQARFQVRMIDRLTDVTTFRIYDIKEGVANDFVKRLAPDIDAELIISETPRDAAESDALITVTDSKTPVLDDECVPDTGVVIALGSYQELPDETIGDADHVVVDHVEQCLQRGALSDLADRGELTHTDIDTTIGTVLTEDYERSFEDGDRILFVPIGLGSADISIAEQIYQQSVQQRSVQEFAFL